MVVCGAKQRHISAVATAPAATSVSACPNHAVALLRVNQTVAVDTDPPTDKASSVRITLDKIDGHWLISGFDQGRSASPERICHCHEPYNVTRDGP